MPVAASTTTRWLFVNAVATCSAIAVCCGLALLYGLMWALAGAVFMHLLERFGAMAAFGAAGALYGAFAGLRAAGKALRSDILSSQAKKADDSGEDFRLWS